MIERSLRVAVTRDEPLDGPLSAALLRRGLEPVPCSVVFAAPPPEPGLLRRAAHSLERFDWLIVASQRALSALMAERGDRPLPPTLRTAAVGERTAALLVAAGARAPLTPVDTGSAALIDMLRNADRWPGRRALLPRALEGGRELAGALLLWGASVDEVVAYETKAWPRARILAEWQKARPDAVVVASPSAARALVDAVGTERLRRPTRVAAIGVTTAVQLRALGVPAMVSPRSDFDSIAEMLAGASIQEARP